MLILLLMPAFCKTAVGCSLYYRNAVEGILWIILIVIILFQIFRIFLFDFQQSKKHKKFDEWMNKRDKELKDLYGNSKPPI